MTKSGKRVGVVLAGCGYLDGAEVQESVLALLALDRAGAQVTYFAPADVQLDEVDHQKRKGTGAKRSVLADAARITRGDVHDLATAKASDLDALVFPGGYGAAKNLCNYATQGRALTVHPEVTRLVGEMRAAGKPLGFICIAPVIAAKVLGAQHPLLTIGDDVETAGVLESLGARHQVCRVDEIAVDEKLKVVSTPAYMLGPSVAKVAQGIDKLVEKVLALA